MALAVGQGNENRVEVEEARRHGLIGLVGEDALQPGPGALRIRAAAARRFEGNPGDGAVQCPSRSWQPGVRNVRRRMGEA